jgi:hypothetical protein
MMMMMMKLRVKGYHLVLIYLAALLCNLHRLYDGTDFRIDPYLLYDYAANSKYIGRKISMVLYEYGVHFSRLIPWLLLWVITRNWILFVSFWFFAFDTLGYILVFGQGWNPWTIASTILVFFILLFYRRWKKKNRIKYIGSSL